MFPRLASTTKLALLACIVTFTASAHAQGPSKAAPAGKDEKLDVTDLEKKYWAAKDDEFNVVQNRLYSKSNRFALTVNSGMYVGDPWSEGLTNNVELGYFPNERYGVSLAYSKTDSKDNEALQSLKQQLGFANHNKMKGFTGAVFNWVPFYAKASVMNKSITYFDMSFSPGIGMVEYEQQLDDGNKVKSSPALTLDITQHFFVNKYVAVRVDYKNRWFNEEVLAYRLTSRTGATTNLNRTDLLMLGLTLYY
ncbi:MAG: outer membrane beta-barrel domain-containing protein [Bdellovibrionota bacterium]